MSRRVFGILLTAVIVIGLLSYGLFEARRLLEGPLISIDSPRDGSATSSTAIRIEGTAQNISFLSINDKPSFTDKDGRFSQLLSIPPGFTVLTVVATDRFGRRSSRSVSINVLNYCSLKNT